MEKHVAIESTMEKRVAVQNRNVKYVAIRSKTDKLQHKTSLLNIVILDKENQYNAKCDMFRNKMKEKNKEMSNRRVAIQTKTPKPKRMRK